MNYTNYVVLDRDKLNLVSGMFDHRWRHRYAHDYHTTQYVKSKSYMNFFNFHMMVSFFRGLGMQMVGWSSDMFKLLAKFKDKIYFELEVDELVGSVKIVKVVYDEKPDRMGLWIKKLIMRTFHEYGFTLRFEEKFSRSTGKSFFQFA